MRCISEKIIPTGLKLEFLNKWCTKLQQHLLDSVKDVATTITSLRTEIQSASCASCSSSYIGETCRHFKTRIEEQKGYQKG